MNDSFESVSRLTAWLRDHGTDKTQVWRDDLAEVLRMAGQREKLLAASKQYLETLRASVRPFSKSADVRAPNVMALADQRMAAMRDLETAIAEADGTTP